jgi:hypothetical protein
LNNTQVDFNLIVDIPAVVPTPWNELMMYQSYTSNKQERLQEPMLMGWCSTWHAHAAAAAAAHPVLQRQVAGALQCALLHPVLGIR